MKKDDTQAFGVLLVLAALVTLGLKWIAYHLSNSVGLFSDAAESLANLSAAFLALFALTYAKKPADRDHPYGHEKIEFFSSGIEGALIVIASFWIVYEAILRFFHPKDLSNILLSVGGVLVAALVNGLVAKLLLKQAKAKDSIVLEASAKHLLADVWTTVGVVLGLGLFWFTAIRWLDPLLALLVGIHVIWSGLNLLKRSYQGLMDATLPKEEVEKIKTIIHHHLGSLGKFHALRTRKSGPRRFVDFHWLMPGHLSLEQAHERTLKLERELESSFEEMDVTVHMEPVEDPKSWEEDSLSRRVKQEE